MKNYYYYDEKECQFIPVRFPLAQRIVLMLSQWILIGTVLSGIAVSLLSFAVGTPAEIALKAENEALYNQLEDTRSTISYLDEQIATLADTDEELYRTMLGIDPLDEEERQAGIGGADLYSDFDAYSESSSELLRWTASSLESMERRINIQQVSFKEIKAHYNENKELMSNIPAIRPVSGIILSGYGMREHPVLGYRRMHHGVDFRARIGTPVYATGDGVVKSARRHGTYGLLLTIDHGHGYETRYAHLSEVKNDLSPGDKVQRGDIIAKSGNSGVTSGPHLHYEVHRNGRSVDPMDYMFADLTPDEYIEYRRIADSNPMSMD